VNTVGRCQFVIKSEGKWIVCLCNSLVGKCPDILKIWDYERNKGIDPTTLGTSSSIKVSFVCYNSTCKRKCIHRWETWIISQTKSPGCRFCNGSKICPCASFYETNEKLRKEWHPHKNNHLDPFSISPGSDISAWWLCPKTSCEKGCPHEWQAAISQPYCFGHSKICECNSFFTVQKELMHEWHPTKNVHVNPKLIFVHSTVDVMWKCTHCRWEWLAKPSCRSIGVGKGCRRCNRFGGMGGKGAKEVEKVLHELKEDRVPGFSLDFKPEQRLHGMVHKKPLWLDQYITSPQLKRPCAIEYDGHLHFQSKENNEKEWLETVRRDLAKNKYLVQHRIHFLRISYKYPKDKIRNLIHNFLGNSLFHEQESQESYLMCSCPAVYKKLRDDSLPFIAGAKE
jgi:hypothetical protein